MTPPALELRPLPEQPRAEQRALLALRNEPEVRHNMYDGDLIEPATHERWLDGIAANRRADYHLVYLDDTLIGMVAFTNIDQTHKRADWAFYITGILQGRGIGTALERSALDYAFGPLGLNKLNCEVIDWNEAVMALHKRFGFLEEGRRRAHVWRDGEYHDAVLLGLTRQDWAARQRT